MWVMPDLRLLLPLTLAAVSFWSLTAASLHQSEGFGFPSARADAAALSSVSRAVINATTFIPSFTRRRRTPANTRDRGGSGVLRYVTAAMRLRTLTMEPRAFLFSTPLLNRETARVLALVLALVSAAVSLFSLQLQKRKEREEQLEDVIQAYEKIHMEKSNLQRDLDKMVRPLLAHPAVDHGKVDESRFWQTKLSLKYFYNFRTIVYIWFSKVFKGLI